MLPPSPPQHYLSRGQSGTGLSMLSRDPPAVSSNRSGSSSMSISSMLGSDTERPSRESIGTSLFSRPSASSAPYAGASSPSIAGAMSPSTAAARPSSLEYPLFQRSQTPEKNFATKTQPARPYRSTSGGTHPVEVAKYGSSRLTSSTPYSEKPHAKQLSPQVPNVDSPFHERQRLGLGGSTVRPSSQPQHVEPAARPPAYSSLSRSALALSDGPAGPAQNPAHRSHSFLSLDNQQSRFTGVYNDRPAPELASRDLDKFGAPEPDSQKASRFPPLFGSLYGDKDSIDRQSTAPVTWEPSRSQPPSPETKRYASVESTSGFGFGAIQSYTKSLGSQLGSSRPSTGSVPPRMNQPSPPPREQSISSKLQPQNRLFPMTTIPPTTTTTTATTAAAAASTTTTTTTTSTTAPAATSTITTTAAAAAATAAVTAPPTTTTSASFSTGQQHSVSGLSVTTSVVASDEQRRKGSEELAQHRSFLGVGMDVKRGGRASPLPQAVQGAQARVIGPSGESGRVFSGIGSGVGGVTVSTGAGSGPTSTASLTASPFKRDSFTGRIANQEVAEDVKIARPDSTTGKRSRKAIGDEEMQADTDNASDSRPGLLSRGAKRGRHTHHHHHQ